MFNKYDAIRLLISALALVAIFNSIGSNTFSIDDANARVIDYTQGK